MNKFALIFLFAAFACIASAMEPMDYRNSAEEQRFRALVEKLRCVMCQNQSLADSSAPIAHDLRQEVLLLMHQGKSDDEIKQYLVARYSDFVLYQPTVKPMTWLLWFGPGVILIGGGIVIGVIVKRRSQLAPDAASADDQQEW